MSWIHERYPILRVKIVQVEDHHRNEQKRSARPFTMRQKGARRQRGQIQTGFRPSGRGAPDPVIRNG